MNKLFTLLVILTLCLGCNQKSDLLNVFNCDYPQGTIDFKTLNDINKTYSISFPSHWKSSFYFDENQSDIYLADTTKSLTSTYILNISKKNGILTVDENLSSKLNSAISKENLQLVKSDSLIYLESTSYYIHAKGFKNNFNYQHINILKPSKANTFLDIKIEVYGDEKVNERFCEAIYFVGLLQDF